MSESVARQDDQHHPKPIQQALPEMQPGFCTAACTDKPCMLAEINKPPLKTSDVYATCNLPKRYEHPHWFNGYGCQMNKQHPFFRTTSSDYGWYPPSIHTVPAVFYPASTTYSTALSLAGMYRNYSLNTGLDAPVPNIS